MNSLFNSKINAVKINASTFTIKTPPETAKCTELPVSALGLGNAVFGKSMA